MDGPFQSGKRTRKPIINITPLIDVMLILLIFVMTSSTFRRSFGIDVTLPSAASSAQQPRSPYEILVLASGDIRLGDLIVTPDQLRAALRQAIAQDAEATFVLRGDKAAPFQSVVTAIDIAREAGGTRLVIPTEPISPSPTSPVP